MLAFYIGGMGAKDKKFHVKLTGRMGFEKEVTEVQRLFLEGKRAEPRRAVKAPIRNGSGGERWGRWDRVTEIGGTS